jgi:hypothetical protein
MRRSVSDDWIAALPQDKSEVFQSVVRRWESSYGMMSVALDDAVSMRARGQLVCARQEVSIVADLLSQLAATLVAACDTLASCGRHLSDLPVVDPLKTEFFRGDTGQSAASWNGLLHHVLFADRSRFFHKLRILSETVEQLGREFDQTAEEILEGTSVQPGNSWKTLDSLHYDFSTCLREAEVMLKCFLRALPSEQLPALVCEVGGAPRSSRVRLRARLSRASA